MLRRISISLLFTVVFATEFDGESADGNWVLNIEDVDLLSGNPQLTLNGWSITVDTEDPPQTSSVTETETVSILIPDAVPGDPATSTIVVPQSVIITGVSVTPTFNHPDISELYVTLTSPAGTVVDVGPVGGSFSDFNLLIR